MSYNGLGEDGIQTARIHAERIRGYRMAGFAEGEIPDVVLDEEYAIAPSLADAYSLNGHGMSLTHALGLAEDDDARYFAGIQEGPAETAASQLPAGARHRERPPYFVP